MGVESGQGLVDCILDTGGLDQVLIGIGGYGKAVRHLDPVRGEILIHLAERGVFAADDGDIINADIIEPEDEFLFVRPSHIFLLSLDEG